MAEPEKKVDAPAVKTAPKPKAAGDGYIAKYVRISKVKELFVENAVKIRVSGDAKEDIAKYLDAAIEKAVKELINKLPRKSKGDKKGGLSRITIQHDDFAGN